jgi:NADPH:quinone reductase-like Zn-dependent oxidoreductase
MVETKPSTMKSIVKLDGEGNISFIDMPVPQISNITDLLVKMHSAPLNPSDLGNMKGKYGPQSTVFPHTPGFEGSGTVIGVHE